MLRIAKFVVPLAVILFGALAGFRFLSENKPEPPTSTEAPQALSVFAQPVERRTLTFAVQTEGEVRPRSEISVTSQISGRISFISDRFVDGGYIGRGQTIARLDTSDFELSVVRAKAGVAAAEQGLAREQAEADLAIKDLEDLGITDTSALARREPQMAEAQAMLDSARAQLREAELALERTNITAPFNVRVRQRNANVGQFVSAGQSLGMIFATDSVEVPLPLTDEQMGQLGLPLAFLDSSAKRGPTVTFSATVGGRAREWTGRIVRTAAAVNSQSRLVNAYAEIKDPYGKGADDGAPMAPGLFVKAEMIGRVEENVLWAPRAALRGNDQLYIGLIADQQGPTSENTSKFQRVAGTHQLSLREISVLHTDNSGVYFEVGAEIGDLAIVSPIQAAFDGMSLNVREQLPDGTIVEATDGTTSLTSGALALDDAEPTP